jgi:hypothetical protein
MHICPGCKACIEGKVPKAFASDEEMEAFWDAHDPALFPSRPMRLRRMGRPHESVKRIKVTLMLFPGLKEKLETLAAKRGIRYQTLVQQYLTERVEAELQQG